MGSPAGTSPIPWHFPLRYAASAVSKVNQFDAWFESTGKKGEESAEESEERQMETIRQLHKIIKPFMLRYRKE